MEPHLEAVASAIAASVVAACAAASLLVGSAGLPASASCRRCLAAARSPSLTAFAGESDCADDTARGAAPAADVILAGHRVRRLSTSWNASCMLRSRLQAATRTDLCESS